MAYAKRGTGRWHQVLSQSNQASSTRVVGHNSSLFFRNCTIPIHVRPFHRSTSFKQYSGVGRTIVLPKSNDIDLSLSLSSLLHVRPTCSVSFLVAFGSVKSDAATDLSMLPFTMPASTTATDGDVGTGLR